MTEDGRYGIRFKRILGKKSYSRATADEPEYFGKDLPLKEIEALIRPYAGLKTIIIERDMGRPMPEFREALRSVLE